MVARLTPAVSGEGVARRGVCTDGPAARPTKTILFQCFWSFVARRRIPTPLHFGGPRRRTKRLGVRVSCGDLCRRQKHRPSREARPAVLPVAPPHKLQFNKKMPCIPNTKPAPEQRRVVFVFTRKSLIQARGYRARWRRAGSFLRHRCRFLRRLPQGRLFSARRSAFPAQWRYAAPFWRQRW